MKTNSFRYKQALTRIDCLDSSDFTWTKGVGVAELSDLSLLAPGRQLWDDAADVGFAVRSTHTGEIRIFTLTELRRDDGDLVAYVYTTIEDDTAIQIHLLND